MALSHPKKAIKAARHAVGESDNDVTKNLAMFEHLVDTLAVDDQELSADERERNLETLAAATSTLSAARIRRDLAGAELQIAQGLQTLHSHSQVQRKTWGPKSKAFVAAVDGERKVLALLELANARQRVAIRSLKEQLGDLAVCDS